MKKLILSVITIVIMGTAGSVFAQGAEQVNPVAKGNIVVKLFDIGYSFARSGDLYDSNDADIFGVNDSHAGYINDGYFPIGTEINYFIIDGLAVGGSIHYAMTETVAGDDISLWSIGPSVYYYYPLFNNIYPYATISYIYTKVQSNDSNDNNDPYLQRIPVGAGALLMLGEHLGLYSQFTYAFNKQKSSSDEYNGKVALISIGVRVLF